MGDTRNVARVSRSNQTKYGGILFTIAVQPRGESADTVRFGPFEVDLKGGVLRKHGIRIKLQFQPLQVLVALLDQPGLVVTREELREQLWRNDTVVDFEHGLNAAVTRLRQALGDSADHPKYIETLAKRG